MFAILTTADHLHIRGENRKQIFQLMKSSGSPPHTWRKQKANIPANEEFRITSTYVEKTNLHFIILSMLQDHLHIRGENYSSPLYRLRRIRITSTYVEKTRCLKRAGRESKDHLHIRGENHTLQNQQTHQLGSPPHTWRKLVIFPPLSGVLRITSTYVEKTYLAIKFLHSIQDHLHIRGENFMIG